MKKLLLIAAALTATTASALTKNIDVTANVQNACVFDDGEVTASFNYSALDANPASATATATLFCNSGFSPEVLSALVGSATLSNLLNINYTLTPYINTVSTGQYAGASRTNYELAVTAAAGQWGATTGAATYTYTVNVNF